MISRFSQKSLIALGDLIKVARQEHFFSQAAFSKRLCVTRQTIMAIEKGDPKVAIGTVFEAAYLLGVPLFAQDNDQLSKWQSVLADFSAILPKRTRRKKYKVNNDF